MINDRIDLPIAAALNDGTPCTLRVSQASGLYIVVIEAVGATPTASPSYRQQQKKLQKQQQQQQQYRFERKMSSSQSSDDENSGDVTMTATSEVAMLRTKSRIRRRLPRDINKQSQSAEDSASSGTTAAVATTTTTSMTTSTTSSMMTMPTTALAVRSLSQSSLPQSSLQLVTSATIDNTELDAIKAFAVTTNDHLSTSDHRPKLRTLPRDNSTGSLGSNSETSRLNSLLAWVRRRSDSNVVNAPIVANVTVNTNNGHSDVCVLSI